MKQSRRFFLSSLGTVMGAGALGAVSGKSALHAFVPTQQKRKLERIGLQLYTVRSLTRNDMPGTLEKVAQLGYKEVEFAGYSGLPPAEVRALLARNGLTSPSTHVGLSANADTWKKALDDSVAIGHEWITVPSVPGGFDRATQDGWKQLADRFNKAGQEAKAAGLRFAFHNHDAEFRDVQGGIPFEILLANTDPALVHFQIDIYWMTRAGRNVLDYYSRFPGRFPMVHVKDSSGAPAHNMVEVGTGSIDFATIFARGISQGTKHFFVEHDNPADAMASIRISAEYLLKLEF